MDSYSTAPRDSPNNAIDSTRNERPATPARAQPLADRPVPRRLWWWWWRASDRHAAGEWKSQWPPHAPATQCE